MDAVTLRSNVVVLFYVGRNAVEYYLCRRKSEPLLNQNDFFLCAESNPHRREIGEKLRTTNTTEQTKVAPIFVQNVTARNCKNHSLLLRGVKCHHTTTRARETYSNRLNVQAC